MPMQLKTENVADQRSGFRMQHAITTMVAFAMLTSVLFSISQPVDARGASRSRYHNNRYRYARSAASAQRQQWIRILQQQVAVARQTLATAESSASMTKAELDQAMSKLTQVRLDINATHVEVVSAVKSLRAIEAEILAEQPEGSPWKQHLATVELAKQESHAAVHRVLGLADHADSTDSNLRLIEIKKMTHSQRQILDADTTYREAEQRLTNAAAEGSLLQKGLFAADADWVSANEGVLHAKRQSHPENQELKTTTVMAVRERNELRSEQIVAAMARAIIIEGEARLRQLGVRTSSKTATSARGR